MPKKSHKLKTAILAVVDETGSMAGRAAETRKTFNNYFDEIEATDPTARVTVANFSDDTWYDRTSKKVRFVCENVTVEDMPYLDEENYSPRGSTPLLDAVGNGIRALEKQKADRYLLVILTDGQENCSTEYTQAQINKMVSEKEESENWTIYYLGAGKDAWAGGQFLGMRDVGKIYNYSGAAGTTLRAGGVVETATSSFLSSNDTKAPDIVADSPSNLWVPGQKEQSAS